MPQYDWIETAEFETAIRTRIEERLREAGITGMPYTFTGELKRMARENRPILESREPARTREDALASR